MTPRNKKRTSTLKKYNQYINTCEQHELPMEREWNRGCGICRQFLPIRHLSCCSRLIPIVVISDDTGNNSYNNLKSIPIWKIYISHTFPLVSRRTFESNNLCYWLSNFRVITHQPSSLQENHSIFHRLSSNGMFLNASYVGCC